MANNGDHIRFWKDRWVGQSTLERLPRPRCYFFEERLYNCCCFVEMKTKEDETWVRKVDSSIGNYKDDRELQTWIGLVNQISEGGRGQAVVVHRALGLFLHEFHFF